MLNTRIATHVERRQIFVSDGGVVEVELLKHVVGQQHLRQRYASRRAYTGIVTEAQSDNRGVGSNHAGNCNGLRICEVSFVHERVACSDGCHVICKDSDLKEEEYRGKRMRVGGLE